MTTAELFTPWEFENDEQTLDNWLIRDAEDGIAAILPKGPTDAIKERQLSRARMMSAAPELLAALRELLDISVSEDHGNHFRAHDAEEAARAAISKATA